jgi:GDP-4-dehydro-6-deoxy-D-mannose reductase
MQRKISLITGATGFVGSHLTDLLITKNHKLYGISRGSYGNEYVKHIGKKITLIPIDILDKKLLLKTIREVKPDYIFHFAAQSSNIDSFEKPNLTFEINLLGTLNLLEAVVIAKLKPSIVIAGSSEEYGLVKPQELPIKENNPLRPQNPYAVSKVAVGYLSYQYSKSHDLRIMTTRSFNQEGPRRQERYVISNFAKQIVEIENGLKDPVIHVGNLEVKRDFLDIRDAVKGYWSLARKGESGEVYNLCSMKPRSIRAILDALSTMSLIEDIKIHEDPKRMRPSEMPVHYGDNRKITKKTGWKPKIDFMITLKDTLEYWREKLKVR